MFKRARWIMMGVGMGASGSVWVRRRLRRFLRNYTPPAVATRAADSAKGQFKAAMADGKAAMRERETQLRQEVERRTR